MQPLICLVLQRHQHQFVALHAASNGDSVESVHDVLWYTHAHLHGVVLRVSRHGALEWLTIDVHVVVVIEVIEKRASRQASAQARALEEGGKEVGRGGNWVPDWQAWLMAKVVLWRSGGGTRAAPPESAGRGRGASTIDGSGSGGSWR